MTVSTACGGEIRGDRHDVEHGGPDMMPAGDVEVMLVEVELVEITGKMTMPAGAARS